MTEPPPSSSVASTLPPASCGFCESGP
jgi:hypothetical protein